MHACLRTYLHTYMNSFIHTYIYTYIRTYVHTYTDIHTQTYIHRHTQTYIHIHTYTSCEWELGYGITYVPTYIALIFPLPRGHERSHFGSSHYSCRSPRKEHSCRSCDPVVVSKDNPTHYLQEAYIG